MTSSNKSSETTGHQILAAISPEKAERLLLDWVNLHGSWPLTESREKYLRTDAEITRLLKLHSDVLSNLTMIGIVVLRDLMRRAWDTPDPRHREWYIFKFRDFCHTMTTRIDLVRTASESSKPIPPLPFVLPGTEAEAAQVAGPLSEPPKITPLEAVGFYLQKNTNRMRHCPNPDCATPYFLAMKKGQKYCSTVCARPSQLESKRRWWSDYRAGKKRTKGQRRSHAEHRTGRGSTIRRARRDT